MDSDNAQTIGSQNKNLTDCINQSDISWTLLERLIISTYNRAKTWCVCLYIAALLILYILSHIVILNRDFIISHLNKGSILDFRDYPSTIIACQVTLLAIVYPLIIGMVSVFIQKNEYSRRVFFVYQKHSGFIFLSLNGLTLSLFILTAHLLRPVTPTESHYVSSIIAIIWFTFSLILTGYFLISTTNILNSDSRERLVIRDTFLDFYADELKDKETSRSIIGKINKKTKNQLAEHIGQSEKNILFTIHNKIVVGFRPIIFHAASMIFYIKHRKKKLRLFASQNHEAFRIHSESSLIPLTYLERKLIILSFKTKKRKNNNHIEKVTSTITAPIIESIIDENLPELKLAITKLINWHNSIANYSTVRINGKTSNLLAMKNSDGFFGISYLENMLHSYLKLIDTSLNKFHSDQSYFIELIQLHVRLYIYSNSADDMENELLIKYNTYTWNKLLSQYNGKKIQCKYKHTA